MLDELRRLLAGPLPGKPAQDTMRPIVRPERITRIPIEESRAGAVLILLIPDGVPRRKESPVIKIPLIERTDDGGPHAGQIALPGGSSEPGDRSLVETALRESEEEIGLDTTRCRILGSLTPLHIDVSGFLITPVVAYYEIGAPAPESIPFRPNPREVRRIIPVTADSLVASRRVEPVEVRGYRLTAPVYRTSEAVIWGATAMILAEFAQIWSTAVKDHIPG